MNLISVCLIFFTVYCVCLIDRIFLLYDFDFFPDFGFIEVVNELTILRFCTVSGFAQV